MTAYRTSPGQRLSARNRPAERCDRGLLADAGIIKAHWECWARCSLACPFCYRSKDVPLSTPQAEDLLATLDHGGVKEIVFAGGDPSLRRDLGHLLHRARELDLHTEVQTNAHLQLPSFFADLEHANLVGLSLDGDSAEAHDAFRGRRKNFDRVLELASILESRAQPFVVRTVVAKSNMQQLDGIGKLLGQFKSLRRWSLVQFTPIGDGFTNRARYEIDTDDFHRVAWSAAEHYPGSAEVNVYPNSRKSGVYFIIGPSGSVHSGVDGGAMATYPSAGNILHDSMSEILPGVSISPRAHSSRYRGLFDPHDSEANAD